MTEDIPQSLEEAEKRARQTMQRQLEQHLKLNLLTINTMAFVLGSAPVLSLTKVKQSYKIVTLLLNRVSNDIRSAGLLAWYGYTLQATAQISNCYESAFAVAFMGSNDEEAQRWIDHNDPTTSPFGNIKDLTRKALQNLNVPDVNGQTTREYITYRQLCWAKHANPILQKSFGLESKENKIVLFNGPDTSEESIRVGCYALEYSAHLAYLALCSFIDNHLTSIPDHTMLTIKHRLTTLGSEKHLLAEFSMKRFGDTDPFPGRWKT